ncbi:MULTISPECIES: glutathione S-transferase N-terminal domain-containing protein [unclassified Acinetobacter]|uniref:glutathione S-transferase N-terminal domain-containing protein n=1 Tax=unclassified Acinetobacter TaxID=196816 RepID=UPI0035BB3278
MSLELASLEQHRGISLYSHHDDFRSHVVRFILAEKNIQYRLILIDEPHDEDLTQLNPYASLPTLVDNQVKLYNLSVIVEYLDERYRQQSLFADTPSQKAEQRQLLWRIERDWLKLADTLLCHPDSLDKQASQKAKQELSDTLTSLEPLFRHYSFFMSEQFSVLDCLLAPLLLRLLQLNLINQQHNTGLCIYAKRVIQRPSFQKSYTEYEQKRYSSLLKSAIFA